MSCLLLVEDSPDITWIVQRLGRRTGHEVMVCSDVPAAWEALHQRRPDLVLLDLNLPGARGEDLCRRVRADPTLEYLPLALFTHWDRPEDVIAGLEAGADYVVSKELLADPVAWGRRLADCLGRSPSPLGGAGLGVRRFDTGSQHRPREREPEERQPPVLRSPELPPEHPSSPSGGLADAAEIKWEQARCFSPPRPGLVNAVNGVLRHPLARQLGPDVLRFVVSRAWRASVAPAAPLPPEGTPPDVALAAVGPRAQSAFARALAHQFWCLLGSEVVDALGPLVLPLPAAASDGEPS